jgi:hypothetical protein
MENTVGKLHKPFAVAFACARLTIKICNNGMSCDRIRIELHERCKRGSKVNKEVKSTGRLFRILFLRTAIDTCEEIFDVERFNFEFFYKKSLKVCLKDYCNLKLKAKYWTEICSEKCLVWNEITNEVTNEKVM